MANIISSEEQSSAGQKNNVREVAKVCRALGDELRLEIIMTLAVQDLSVGELSKRFPLSESALSHKLRFLRDADLLTRYKDGKKAIYSLNTIYLQQLSEEWLFRLLIGETSQREKREGFYNGIS